VYRAEYKRPFSVLKYAMTLDGKIAASTGHAAWVSGKESRQKVFAMRARSDAIIVGGNTVRRDSKSFSVRIVVLCCGCVQLLRCGLRSGLMHQQWISSRYVLSRFVDSPGR
jgi:riboflavin biosynthesis pyrimidine reductase